MSAILPTCKCFDNALDYVYVRLRETRLEAGESALERMLDGLELALVHGILTTPNGRDYAHAWAEDCGLAWDAGIVDGRAIWYALPVRTYRAVRGVRAARRYTPREAALENLRAGHYGPWRPELLALVSASTVPLELGASADVRPVASRPLIELPTEPAPRRPAAPRGARKLRR